ncbi:MAG: hypothetical protein DMF66_00085 [Acidobacteria bacterium]|nr:MAG: hypothetical protein DMF66_00085 [Acidobacteriota bacterium]
MGLSEIEQILARLSTDEGLRGRFVDDPFALGRELGLSAAESRQLRREAAARFDSFAASSRERRLVEMGKLLPLTRRVLGNRFAAHFKRYVSTHKPGGIERLFGDAIGFAGYLEKSLRGERVGSGWRLELLRYERAPRHQPPRPLGRAQGGDARGRPPRDPRALDALEAARPGALRGLLRAETVRRA